jgi:hypothetical protein
MPDTGRERTSTLTERLEELRLKGARNRLALCLALTDLREEAGQLRGAGIAMNLLRAFSGRGGLAGWVGELKRLRWLLPFLSSLLSSKGSRRVMRQLRGVLEAGTLGVFIYGLLRRFLRRRADAEATGAAEDRAEDADVGESTGLS